MKKVLIVLLTAMLAFARAVCGAEIGDLTWNEANIKTLKGFDSEAVLRFVERGDKKGEDFSLSDFGEFEPHWYPAGDGKYELAVNSSTGPDNDTLTIYWQ